MGPVTELPIVVVTPTPQSAPSLEHTRKVGAYRQLYYVGEASNLTNAVDAIQISGTQLTLCIPAPAGNLIVRCKSAGVGTPSSDFDGPLHLGDFDRRHWSLAIPSQVTKTVGAPANRRPIF